jgi:hypothetical protein
MNISKKAAFGTTRFYVDSAEINWCYFQPVYMFYVYFTIYTYLHILIN